MDVDIQKFARDLKKSGAPLCVLTEQTVDDLIELLIQITCQYSPSDYDTDWVCASCHERSDPATDDIDHASTCSGIRLLAVLRAVRIP